MPGLLFDDCVGRRHHPLTQSAGWTEAWGRDRQTKKFIGDARREIWYCTERGRQPLAANRLHRLQWVVNRLQWVVNQRQRVVNRLQWVINRLQWVVERMRWVVNRLRWWVNRLRWVVNLPVVGSPTKWVVNRLRWLASRLQLVVNRLQWVVERMLWVLNRLHWVVNRLRWVVDRLHWVVNRLHWVVNRLRWVVNRLRWVVNRLRWCVKRLRWVIERMRWVVHRHNLAGGCSWLAVLPPEGSPSFLKDSPGLGRAGGLGRKGDTPQGPADTYQSKRQDFAVVLHPLYVVPLGRLHQQPLPVPKTVFLAANPIVRWRCLR